MLNTLCVQQVQPLDAAVHAVPCQAQQLGPCSGRRGLETVPLHAPPPPLPLPLQVPHDDNRLLLRNGLMMAVTAGFVAVLGYFLLEAHSFL